MAEFSRLGTHFPRDCDQPIPPDSMVVVLSRFGQASDMAVAALSACWQQNDLHPVVELVKSIDGEPEPFTMVLLRADPGEMSPTTSADVIKTVDLTTARPGDSSAHLEQSAGGVRVTTPSGPGAFAARFKLGLDPGVEGRFIVRVHAKVDNGQIAIGVLDATGARFLVEKPMWASRNSAQVMLQLPSPPVTGDLIVCNMDTHEVRSSATIQKIDIVRAPKQ